MTGTSTLYLRSRMPRRRISGDFAFDANGLVVAIWRGEPCACVDLRHREKKGERLTIYTRDLCAGAQPLAPRTVSSCQIYIYAASVLDRSSSDHGY
jgi:hypothetical protein